MLQATERQEGKNMSFFRKLIVAVLKLIKNKMMLNQKLRALLYDLNNKEEFGSLYEHEKMLADSVRVDNYKKAIDKYIGQSDIVLDLGTGTGILAFFAARKNPIKIYAIDHSEFISIARKISEHNNFTNIEFIKTNSREFKTDTKFDVILHEQIGDYLFNENMVQNLLDIKKRLLKPNGRILPGKFELFLEPTCLVDSFNIPFLWENNLHDVDFRFLKNYDEELEQFKPANYKQEWIEANAVKHFLCEADPILVFDLNELNSENEIPRLIDISKHVVRPGTLDGFCLFFKVIFDEEISFITSPLTTRTHWGNCFFRIESRKCFGGEDINFKLNMPDFLDIKTWSVSIKNIQKKG